MTGTRRVGWGVVLLLTVLLVASASGGVVAQSGEVEITSEATYGGADAETQAVDVTVTITPSADTVENFSVRVRASDQAFVDFDSFDSSTSPAGIEIERRGDGEFFIPQLEEGESVEISFDAYPRTIKEETLPVAFVFIEGSNLEANARVTADLSDSSWFALENARDRIQQQQLLTYAGAAAVLLLVVVGVVALYRRVAGSGGGGGGSGGGGDDVGF